MSRPSVLKELLNRRVPQIIGLYIAATWMMIEIGDWMTERFSTPESVTSYIFIGMVFFIPSVVFLAYQYGKPGKDPLKKTTFVFVPTNIIAAFVAMFYLVTPVEATETRIVFDEKGVQKVFEVPKKEYQNQLVSFFWRNKSGKNELSWMRYGLAWLLSKDLDRSMFISSMTPFNSRSMLSNMKKSGFKDALNIPRSLQIEMARKRFVKYFLEGSFDFHKEKYTLNVDVYNVNTGKLHFKQSVSGKDLLPLIDDLSSNLRQALKIPIDLNDQSNDLPVAEHTSESLIAIEKLIRSNIERQINNDYSAAKTLLEQAIKEDFSFTHAYTHLTRTNQLMGNSMEAAQALSEGLKHEYKLTTEEKFLYRGIAYGLRGNYLSQIKIYDMWIELYPEDVRAYEIMAHLLLITGIDLDKALTSLQQLRKLNPSDQSVLRSMTQLFVLRDELDKAIKSQQSYTSMNPQDNEALIELANIYERTAQFDLAQEIYQRVLLLDMDNHQASIKLALLDLKLGEFESAENRLAILLASVSDNKNRFDILQGYLAYYSARGQLEKVLSTIEQMKENSQHLPPLLKIFNLEFSSSFYLANLGKFDSAHSVLESVRKQLQPPIDTIVELGAASAYLLADDEGKAGQSIEKLEKYIQDYPNPMFSSAIDSSKAMLMKLQGNLEEAIKLSEKSLNVLKGTVVNTQDETSILGQRVLLANMRNANGETQRAKEELLAILKLYPSLAQAHIALAKCYLAENDIESFALSMEHADESWKDADANYIEYKKFIDLRTEHLPK